MKTTTLVPVILFALALVPATPVPLQAAAPTDSEIIAQARASYPLKTCVVSSEPLGNMGEATGYIHRTAGKPDRVVFFCCDGCIDDFKADPAKFLKKIDDAAKAKSAAGKKAEGN